MRKIFLFLCLFGLLAQGSVSPMRRREDGTYSSGLTSLLFGGCLGALFATAKSMEVQLYGARGLGGVKCSDSCYDFSSQMCCEQWERLSDIEKARYMNLEKAYCDKRERGENSDYEWYEMLDLVNPEQDCLGSLSEIVCPPNHDDQNLVNVYAKAMEDAGVWNRAQRREIEREEKRNRKAEGRRVAKQNRGKRKDGRRKATR